MAVQSGIAGACTGEAIKCVQQQSATHASVATMLSCMIQSYVTDGSGQVQCPRYVAFMSLLRLYWDYKRMAKDVCGPVSSTNTTQSMGRRVPAGMRC